MDAGLEGLGGLPTEFSVDLGGIDGVATVVTRAIGDVGDLLFVALAIGAGRELIQDGAERMDDIKVRLLIPSTDIIGLPYPAGLQDAPDGGGMVPHIEPVAHLHPVAVDREGLSGEGVMNDERNEFFGEVVGAVVVGAVRREDGETVGMMVGTDEVIRGRLAGRVRAIRLVLLGLGESGIG